MRTLLTLLFVLAASLSVNGQGTTSTTQVKTVADLIALPLQGNLTRWTVLVTGRNTTNDGGGGVFYYDANSTATTNLGTIFKPTAGAGRFIRQYTGPMYVSWFGVATNRTGAENVSALTNMVEVAKGRGEEIRFGPGTFTLNSHFPIRQPESVGPIVTNEDYHGLTVSGQGQATVIRTYLPGNAADVFNLNGVRNVTIRDLAITATTDIGTLDAPNGVSIIAGGENITLENLYIFDLPYISDDGIGTSGGQGITIQKSGTSTNLLRNIKILNNTIVSATNMVTGIGVQYSGSWVPADPGQQILISGNTVRRAFRGILIESTAYGGGVTLTNIHPMMGVAANNQILECARGIETIGVTGWNIIGNNIISTNLGVPTFLSQLTNKFGASIHSAHYTTFTGNRIFMSNCVYFMFVAGGAAGEANTPCQRIVVSGNVFAGTPTTGFGISSTELVVYGSATNSHFTGNTFFGATTNYHYLIMTNGNNTIIDRDRSTFWGNVGMGTGAPLNALVVANGNGLQGLEIDPEPTHVHLFGFDRAAGDNVPIALNAAASAVARVGIGTTTPANRLVVANGTDRQGIEFAPSTTNVVVFAIDKQIGANTNIPLVLQTSSSLNTNAIVGIGTAFPRNKLVVANFTAGQGLEVSPNSSHVEVFSFDRTAGVSLPLALNLAGANTTNGGNFVISTAGRGIHIAEGSNARMGTAVLNGASPATVTVANTSVTATTRIFLTINTPGGTVGSPYVSARVAATSFTITSGNADTSTVGWLLVEPAP